MTGNLPKTSALYILIMPSLTFAQVLTCHMPGLLEIASIKVCEQLTTEMSSNMGECQRREAVLIYGSDGKRERCLSR
jgi:hypothetical protein